MCMLLGEKGVRGHSHDGFLEPGRILLHNNNLDGLS